jgi:hypothetical protein
MLVAEFQGLVRTRCGERGEAAALKDVAHDLAEVVLVVDDQNCGS